MAEIAVIAMTPLWLVGLVVFWYWFRPIKEKIQDDTGFDVSNRVNRIRLTWLCLSRPWELAKYLEWLKRDEFENY